MKGRPIGILVAALTLWVGVPPADAHHSTGLFDSHKVVEISGTVARFRWINPHASIVIDGGAAGGSQDEWIVEMMAPTAMMDEGWRQDSVAIGDRITVFAHPLREGASVGGAQRLLYAGIILADRRTLGHVSERKSVTAPAP